MRMLLSVVAIAILSQTAAAEASAMGVSMEKENQLFWNRFLENDGSLSITPPPTPPPTAGPTGVTCDVQVDLECKTPDGRECNTLQPPPDNQCASGSDIDTVTFSFQDCTCDPNANSQGDEASCDDAADIPFTDPVDVSCVDGSSGSSMNVSPSTVGPGEIFSVTSPGGGSLPNTITCTIADENGATLQTNTINTSGGVSLQLGDKFGAMDLESCDDITCVEEVCYDVTLSNVGTNDMDITVVDFDLNGDKQSLLDQVEINPLAPGQSTSIEVKEVIDLCTTQEICANVDVEANPPSDKMCLGDDDYKWMVETLPPTPAPTGVACDVQVEIDCKTPSGEPCEELTPPPTDKCADGSDIETVTFNFNTCLCDESDNSQGEEAACSEIRPIGDDETVEVSCTDVEGGGALDVSPTAVTADETFTVTSPGGGALPGKIECAFSDPNTGSKLQINVIDTSGTVALDLKDKFGSMQLESCDDTSCLEEVCYDITLSNVGTNVMDITVVDFIFDEETESLLDRVPGSLDPGQTTSLEEKRFVDVCSGVEICAEVDVEANPPSDKMCEADDKYQFLIPTLPPTPPPSPGPSPAPSPEPTLPDCEIDLDVECRIASGEFEGTECEAARIGVEPCRQRPTGATMLYNGGDCSQSDNRQFLKFTCEDTANGPPPTEEGAQSYIVVTDAKGKGITYHRGFVGVGSQYRLETPEGDDRFEADQRIMIYSSDNIGDPANLLQEVQYHSSCSSNLELKNRFGASQLVEFENEEQGVVSCFANLELQLEIVIPIDIEGTSATIDKLTTLTNFGGFTDHEEVKGMEITPGGTVAVTITASVDLTERRRYTILTQVTATAEPSGQTCVGTDFNSFYAGNVPPGSVPTDAPTIAPTVSPAPTSNPLTAACTTEGVISCMYLNDDGRILGECDDIVDPRTISCTNDLQATGLEMRYLGGVGLPDTVHIEVSGGRSGTVFSGIISVGETFRAEGDFRGEAEIVISDENQDSTLEQITLNMDCEGDDTTLTLTSTFGPLELTGFENAYGWLTSLYDIRLQYAVANIGGVAMVAESAIIASQFETVPIEAIQNDVPVPKGAQAQVYQEVQKLDAGAKWEAGELYEFTMNVKGRGARSGVECSSETTFSF